MCARPRIRVHVYHNFALSVACVCVCCLQWNRHAVRPCQELRIALRRSARRPMPTEATFPAPSPVSPVAKGTSSMQGAILMAQSPAQSQVNGPSHRQSAPLSRARRQFCRKMRWECRGGKNTPTANRSLSRVSMDSTLWVATSRSVQLADSRLSERHRHVWLDAQPYLQSRTQ